MTGFNLSTIDLAAQLGITIVLEDAQKLVELINNAYRRGLSDAGPFATDIVAHEREACAKLVEHHPMAAAAIRARGQS